MGAAEDTGISQDGGFWFNRKTGEVEAGQQSLAIDRIGPFETRAEAERALETVRERARAWAEEEAADD